MLSIAAFRSGYMIAGVPAAHASTREGSDGGSLKSYRILPNNNLKSCALISLLKVSQVFGRSTSRASIFTLFIVLSFTMLLQAFTILSLSLSAFASPTVQPRRSSSLADLALQKVLSDASPIFGYYTKNSTKYSTWMSKYPDSTNLVHSMCSLCPCPPIHTHITLATLEPNPEASKPPILTPNSEYPRSPRSPNMELFPSNPRRSQARDRPRRQPSLPTRDLPLPREILH